MQAALRLLDELQQSPNTWSVASLFFDLFVFLCSNVYYPSFQIVGLFGLCMCRDFSYFPFGSPYDINTPYKTPCFSWVYMDSRRGGVLRQLDFHPDQNVKRYWPLLSF